MTNNNNYYYVVSGSSGSPNCSVSYITRFKTLEEAESYAEDELNNYGQYEGSCYWVEIFDNFHDAEHFFLMHGGNPDDLRRYKE